MSLKSWYPISESLIYSRVIFWLILQYLVIVFVAHFGILPSRPLAILLSLVVVDVMVFLFITLIMVYRVSRLESYVELFSFFHQKCRG